MSKIQAAIHKVGISNDPANNFLLDASAQDGGLVLKRESGQVVLTVGANGTIKMPYNLRRLEFTFPSTVVFSGQVYTISTPFNPQFVENSTDWNSVSGEYTATVAGLYQINCSVGATSPSTSALQLIIYKNNIPISVSNGAALSTGVFSSVSTTVRLAVGDKVRFTIQAVGTGTVAATGYTTSINLLQPS